MIKPVPIRLFEDSFLATEERTSPVWLSLKDRLEKKLAELRLQNDHPKLTDVETATLRGHIQCLKAVLALGNEPPPKVATEVRPRPRPEGALLYG